MYVPVLYSTVEKAAVPPRGKRGEDYLRVIYELTREHSRARVKEISEKLGVSMPSVVEALQALEDQGLVKRSRRGVTLTSRGAEKASRLLRKRGVLKRFLSLLLAVSEDVAEREACFLEHVVSKETLDRMEKFLEFVDSCPMGLPRFLEHLYYYYEKGIKPEGCGPQPAEEKE